MNRHCILSGLAILLLCLFGAIQHVSAQKAKGSVKGNVHDISTRAAVEFAAVSVKSTIDSFAVGNTVTDKSGNFSIGGLEAGSYELWVSFVGYKMLRKSFTISGQALVSDLGELMLEPGIDLKEVAVQGERAPITIKKDTVEYNAGSFKTQPNDNVEELLKKLPGVEVDKDGKITAQGKTVNKVLVDGKEFFGNDPKAATKNLPADAIDKVQLIDDKTDQAKNTGIDDGQREKVLNLTVKADKKKGWFGNASLAGGSGERYLGQLSMNRFDKDKQLSLLFLSNNVNQSGFSFDDLNNFSGGNIFESFGGGTGGVSINVSRNGSTDINGTFSGVGTGGHIVTHSGGVNFSNTYGKKKQLKLNTSYLAIISSNTISRISDIQDPLNNEQIYTSQSSVGENGSNIHRVNLNLDYKADSLTRIQFKPNFSFSQKTTLNNQAYSSVNQVSAPVNSGTQFFDQKVTNPYFGGQFTVNRQMGRNRGSVNLFINGNYTSTSLNYTNRSLTKYRIGNADSQNAFNQQSDQDGDRKFADGSLSYIFPLNKPKKLNMTLRNNYQYTNDIADQVTFEYNSVTGRYETLVPAFTNEFDNRNWRNTVSGGINKGGEKLTYTVNAAVSYLGLSGEIEGGSGSNIVERRSLAFVPNASLSYRKKNGRSLFVNAGTTVSMPSISNLQPVYNNTNPLYIRQGNPNLGMSRSVNFNANYNYFDLKTNNYVNFYSAFTQTWNGFSTESTVDPNSRIQTVRPVNVDGIYNLTAGANSGLPTKIKGLRLRAGANGSLIRNINFINGGKNDAKRITAGVSGGISYTKDRLSVSVDNRTGYNSINNSLQELAGQRYYSFDNTLTLSGEPVKTLRIFADLSQTIYKGTSSNSLSDNIYLLNAGIEKFFMEKRQLSLVLSGFDLLDQNSNIQRSVSQTGRIEDYRTNNLNRYLYLKLTYKLQRIGGAPTPSGNIMIMR